MAFLFEVFVVTFYWDYAGEMNIQIKNLILIKFFIGKIETYPQLSSF